MISLLNVVYNLYARILNKRIEVIAEALIGEERMDLDPVARQ